MGNVIFTNNRLNRMGVELGAVKFTESIAGEFKDCIFSNNIVTRSAPSGGGLNAELLDYPTIPTTEGIIEQGNAVRAGS